MRTARSSFRGGTLGTPFPRLHLPVSTQGMRRFQIDAIFLRLHSWNCFQKSPSSLTFLWVFWWVWKTDKQDKKGNHSVSKKHLAYMGLWPQNKDVVKILPQRRMIFFTKWCFSLSSVCSSIHVRNQVPKDQLSENRRPISTHWRLALLRETAGYHNR